MRVLTLWITFARVSSPECLRAGGPAWWCWWTPPVGTYEQCLMIFDNAIIGESAWTLDFGCLSAKIFTDRQFTGHPCFANSGAQHRQTLFTCLVLTDLPVWILVQPPEQLLRLNLVVGGPLAHNLVHGAQRSAQANISAKFLSLQIIVKNGPKFEYLGSWQEIT